MNSRNIAYWITTGLCAFVFLSGGAVDVARPAFAVEGIAHLGYPSYFLVILGVWKVLGGVAIVAPRLPRLKEWAYAGMLFDLTGAAASHASVGDPAVKIATPLIILLIVIASWALRPRSRVLREVSSDLATA
ncbi:MAG TPA: DoxX family protein [Tepidisphaeraceae bacterium]|nr:DoxX family protein [Tepidisphaeraceae bacterium]